MFPSQDHFLQSPPCPVSWEGWRSDTHLLQNFGWQISVEKDIQRRAFRILMRHSVSGLIALSGFCDFEFTDYIMTGRERLHFELVAVGKDIHMVRDHAPRFSPIDATPTMIPMKQFSMREMNVFRPAPMDAEEVLLDKADMTVVEHLEAIKALQSEKQKELRAQARRGYDQAVVEEAQVKGEVVVQLMHYRR